MARDIIAESKSIGTGKRAPVDLLAGFQSSKNSYYKRDRFKKNIENANAQAQTYADKANSGFVNKLGNLVDNAYEGIPTNLTYKDIAKKIFLDVIPKSGKAALDYGRGLESATRTVVTRYPGATPFGSFAEIYGGIKNLKGSTSVSDAISRYRSGAIQGQASQTPYEKYFKTSLTNEDSSINIPAAAKFVSKAVEPATFAYSLPAKSVAPGTNLLSRVFTRTWKSLPEAGINTAIQLGGEYPEKGMPSVKDAGTTLLTNALIFSGINNIAGEFGVRSLAKTISAIEKEIGSPLTISMEELVSESLSQGIKKEKIIESIRKIKAGEVTQEDIFNKAVENFDVKKPEVKQETPANKTKPENPLYVEARKYKSAEDFVRAQGDVVYRGGLPFDKKLFNSGELRGLSVTRSAEDAKDFSGKLRPADKYQGGVLSQGKNGVVEQLSIDRNAKVLNVNDAPKELRDFFNKQSRHEGIEKISLWAEKNGYDAVDFKDFEIRILNPDVIKTKSQLADIYKEATGTAEKKATTEIPKTGKESGYAKSLEVKALEQKLKEDFGELATYEGKTLKSEAELSYKIIDEGDDKVMRILKGEEELSGPLPTSFAAAVERHAQKTGNGDLFEALAKSKYAKIVSEAGQSLSMLQERNKYSPLNIINKMKKMKEAGFERKTGKKLSEVKGGMVKNLQKDIKESAKKERVKTLSKKETWSSFVDAIKC